MHVLIVGCGYVGIELGRQLTPDHRVTGVRRSMDGVAEVADAGLEAVHGDATVESDLYSLPDVDAIVYAASAGRDGDPRETYVDGLRAIIEHFSSRRHTPARLVYTSSTGIYGDHDGDWVDEETPIEPSTERQSILQEAERVALAEGNGDIGRTVVRYGGLYGPGRSPADRYRDGPVSPGYVNLVHRDDAAGAVAHLLTTGRGVGEVVTVVDDEPVDRVELAEWLAQQLEFDQPEVIPLAERDVEGDRAERLAANKRVSNVRLHELGYELSYPTFRDGLPDGRPAGR